MLSNVSWGEFTEAVMILLVLYYLFIGLKYYRKEIAAILSGKLQKKEKPASPKKESSTKDLSNDPYFDELEAVVNDLRPAVFDKAGKSVSKQELLQQLQERLAPYAGLRKPGFKVAINNYIIIHAEEICGIVFSEHELNSAWSKLPG